jgi:hypothetical protein
MKIKVLFLLPMFLMFFGCTSDNNSTPEKETLKNVTYEVLLFEYTPDTGNNTSRFRYDIKFINSNNVALKGVPKLTMNYDGLIISPIARNPVCTEIGANSSCTVSYDVESALTPQNGTLKSIKLVSVEYILSN